MGGDTADGGHHLPGRLRHYLHPSGRKVHIARTPDEATALRKTLSQDHQDDSFDLVIQGSPEHLSTLQELRAHQEGRRATLRAQHGAAYDEFETVHRELDALAADLAQVTSRSVALDANFDRYGFSAHVRTREADSGTPSGAATPSAGNTRHTSDAGDPAALAARRDAAEVVKVWKRPTVRQYYHKGFIWRSSASHEVAPFELFIDLLYVGIIGILGDHAAVDPTGRAFLECAVVFILAYKMWVEVTQVVAWFETGDLFQRASILVYVSCLVGFTINIEHAFGETYTQLIAFYLANRLFEGGYFVLIAYLIPMVRGVMLASSFVIVVPAAFWVGSIHVEEPDRWALIWLALAFDVLGMGLVIPFVRQSHKLADGPLRGLARHMEFYPAVNIEHKTERMGAFVTLVFGSSVLALLFQSAQAAGISAFYGKAVLGLIIAFVFNMLYFEIDAKNIYTHAIRRHAVAFFFWQNLHIPFILGFTVAAGALARLVLVHDCANTEPELLSEASALNSEAELRSGLRWFFSAGLGAALACMGGIALTHEHKRFGRGQRIKKSHRIGVRFAVAVVLVCLPLAEGLNSLQLIATVTGLVVVVLLVDLLGSTSPGDSVWKDRSKCEYAADCHLRRRDMEDLAAGGGTLEDLAAKNVNEKGRATGQ